MNEITARFIEALAKSGASLHEIVGTQELPKDVRASMAVLKNPNFQAKWQLVFLKDLLFDRAKKLRRSDPKQGDWPPFRAEDAQETLEMCEQIEAIAKIRSKDPGFIASNSEALRPMRGVVQKYGTETQDGWRFPEESADVVEPFPDPPPAGKWWAKLSPGSPVLLPVVG